MSRGERGGLPRGGPGDDFRAAHFLELHHHPQHARPHFPLRFRRNNPPRPIILHQLGQTNVLREKRSGKGPI